MSHSCPMADNDRAGEKYSDIKQHQQQLLATVLPNHFYHLPKQIVWYGIVEFNVPLDTV